MADRKNRVPKRTSPKTLPHLPVVPTPSTKREHWYNSPAAIAALIFACLVLIMWGAYNPHSGFGYETAFPYMSETGPAVRSFFFSDEMRPHTSTFYHLGYLLSEALGVRGSYVPFQVVYALLWWARGMLVFVILRKFLPDCPSLCYCAGALAVVHSSDGALQWVGQLNQFGFIFWMLLAAYCFICAWDSKRWSTGAPLAVATAAFEYMSLWSYESQILLILVFPVIVMLARREWNKPGRLLTWYSVPATYLVITYLRYAHSGGQSYQESVMRKSWSLASIAGDWAFNIGASLEFWNWTTPDWKYPPGLAHILSVLAALIFSGGLWAVIRLGSDRDRENPFAGSLRTCWVLLVFGFVILALSFPVYLMLGSARMLWRTQFLSGVGSGIVMAACLGLLSSAPLQRKGKMALVIAAGAIITYFGSVSAIQKGGFHRWVWERHRTAMLEVLRIAPDVAPRTLIVLTNVPQGGDPFGDNMWFDLAIRLVYPGIPAAGVYYYEDGTPAPGNHMVLEGTSWHWDGKGFGHLFNTTPLASTVVVRYDPSGIGKLLEKLPPFLNKAPYAAQSYQPENVISAPISPIVVRRYDIPRMF